MAEGHADPHACEGCQSGRLGPLTLAIFFYRAQLWGYAAFRAVLVSRLMPSSLHTNLRSLADTFAGAVLDAIRSASLEELLAGAGGSRPGPGRPRGPSAASKSSASSTAAPLRKARRGGRLARRSPEQIAKALDGVVALVKKHKGGLRAEQIRAELGMQAKEMPRVLAEGLSKKKLKRRGRKRATTYTA